mmetsp:Transcript_15734/g.38749  ORF Transcript_15734/g.38749 Transcript_15734/m.38749 type:complete len:417 (-) Transcript_15734:246-1496(-)
MSETAVASAVSKKLLVGAGIVLVVAGAAGAGVVCGTGNCGSMGFSSSSKATAKSVASGENSPSSAPALPDTVSSPGPSFNPSFLNPTSAPSVSPTETPSSTPSSPPTSLPSFIPSPLPTPSPTSTPTKPPTPNPTKPPTPNPTNPPTPPPTPNPTKPPTPPPTPNPTKPPTPNPTSKPTPPPTPNPTPDPTPNPTAKSTPKPTPNPTREPTPRPTPNPTKPPTPNPTRAPTPRPTPPPTSLLLNGESGAIVTYDCRFQDYGYAIDIYWSCGDERFGNALRLHTFKRHSQSHRLIFADQKITFRDGILWYEEYSTRRCISISGGELYLRSSASNCDEFVLDGSSSSFKIRRVANGDCIVTTGCNDDESTGGSECGGLDHRFLPLEMGSCGGALNFRFQTRAEDCTNGRDEYPENACF